MKIEQSGFGHAPALHRRVDTTYRGWLGMHVDLKASIERGRFFYSESHKGKVRLQIDESSAWLTREQAVALRDWLDAVIT